MEPILEMTVAELAQRLAAPSSPPPRWLDVRTEGEWATARVEGFALLDDTLAQQVAALPRDTELVFLCHHGIRSAAAARHFAELGFKRVWNVVGGIDAWSREIDANVPRY